MEYLGIDIGGSNIKWVILNQNGEVLAKGSKPTDRNHSISEEWKSSIVDLIEEKCKESKELGLAISAPGISDEDNRCILTMPERLKGIEGFNWSQHMGLDIHVINDAHAACLAEYEYLRKAEDVQHILLLTLGTGVGGGAIINGKLYQGALQRAGHFGHTTVDHSGVKTMTNMVGSLEYAVGNFSVSERTHGLHQSVKSLVKGYEEGEALATFWWLESIQKLASGLASLINSFSPQIIVLGGGITAGAGDNLLKPLNKFMSLYEWKPNETSVPIKKAHYNTYAGAIGAAFFAKSKFNK